MESELQIGVAGLNGRVSSCIAKLLQSHEKCGFLGGTLNQVHTSQFGVNKIMLAEDMFKAAAAVIDFTSPNALEEHLKFAVQTKTPLIIGTTGLTHHHYEMIEKASHAVPLLYAPNMSRAVNVLFALTEKAAELLNDDYDIEIFEHHHVHKKDSPSGTAIMLGQMAAKGRGRDFKDLAIWPDQRMGQTEPRKKGGIGFSVMRGGDAAGEHRVLFAGQGEILEISDRASSPVVFALGAIDAAVWIQNKPAKLYSMRDVLGI